MLACEHDCAYFAYAINRFVKLYFMLTKMINKLPVASLNFAPWTTKRRNGYNGAPEIRLQEYPFPWTFAKPHYLPHGPVRAMMPNGIRIRSIMHWTEWQTDRSSTGKFDHYRPLLIIGLTTTVFMALSSWHSAIARVHPVHVMNADSAPGGRRPSDQTNRLGLWVRR